MWSKRRGQLRILRLDWVLNRQRASMLESNTVVAKRSSGGDLNPFRDPPWNSPLDAQREIDSIPVNAQIRGMFIVPVVQEARRAGATLGTRDRYVSFQYYPLREHAQLLVEAATAVYPQLPLREGLRRLGRGAPRAFLASTLGRVVLQSAEGVLEVVNALAKGYELSLNPGRASVEQPCPNVVDVTLEQVHFFIDSHHVGAFEGALKYAGQRARIRLQRISASHAVLRIEW